MSPGEREQIAKVAVMLREVETKAAARAAEIIHGDGDAAFISRNAFVRGSLSGACEDAARRLTSLCEPRRTRRRKR